MLMKETSSGDVRSNAAGINERREPRRIPQRERRKPIPFTIKVLTRLRSEHEPTVRSVMSEEHRNVRRTAMDKEVSTLEEIGCWDVNPRPKITKILHTKFVLKGNRSAAGEMKSYNVRLSVCGNGEYENDEVIFLPVPDFMVIKLIICLALQRGNYRRHLGFQNAFPNGKLDCLVYAELPKLIYEDEVRAARR